MKQNKKQEPKKKTKKEVKKDLIGDIKKHKKEIQEMRFSTYKGAQQKSGERKKLRKEVAKAATKLTNMAKETENSVK